MGRKTKRRGDSFAPSGAMCIASSLKPTACAVGYILAPLPGFVTFICALAHSRQLQPRGGQIQSVHNLVVVVPRRRQRRGGELGGVGALEVDHAAAAAVEEGVVSGVVERVVRVRRDLSR